MFGYRLKWNFLKSNFLCLPFNRLGPTTNFFCHRCFYRFSCCAKRLTNNLAIDRFIDTANFLATCLSFLKDTFFISIAICICYIFGFIRKDHCFCNRSFRYLVSWILRLNRGFTYMAFFLRSLSFHNTGISWIFWLYRSFPYMAFFLRSLSFHNTGIGGSFWLYRSFTNIAFLLRSLGFHNTGISWIFWLYRSFTYMTFFLCSLGFHNTGISWVLWLYRSFTYMTFFLCSFSSYNWSRLRTWLTLLLCSNGNYLWNCFFCYSSFKYFADFLTIYRTHFY